MLVPHNPNEIVAVVDEKDKVIGYATRREVHDKGLLHREVALVIINSKEECLVQKRKDNNKWSFSCGGHFPKNQSYIEAVVREAKEEIGLSVQKKELVEVAYFRHSSSPGKNVFNDRFVKVFLLKKDILLSKIFIDKEEVSEVRYFTKKELEECANSKEKVLSSAFTRFVKEYLLL